jgi:Reverse transcriptase (RNA-dependent DNA polymerase)
MAAPTSVCNSTNLSSIDLHQQTITLVSYNMHGFMQGFSTIRDLSHSSDVDVFLLQEHWLTPTNLNKFDMFSDYFAFGCSAMNSCVESGIVRGRPFGGIMILVKKTLRDYTQTVCCAERYAIIKLLNYVIVNVYLPCVGTSDRLLIIEETLTCIENEIVNFKDCILLLGGDINMDLDKHDPAAGLINKFMFECELKRCDIASGCKAEYTYCNESLNCRSCIDYFLSSDTSQLVRFTVIDEGSNLSDHLPISVVVATSVNLNTQNEHVGAEPPTQSYLRWDHADLVLYYELTGRHLMEHYYLLKNKTGVQHESVTNGTIKSFVNNIYSKIVDILRNCANVTVPERKKHFYRFWWNEELDSLKQKSVDDHKLWKSMGKPRHGPIHDKHRASKLLYKQRIREYQRTEMTSYTSELHEALLAKDGPNFWKSWRSKFGGTKSTAHQVDGLVSDNDIVNNFVEHFIKGSSNLTENGNNYLRNMYNLKRSNYCGSPHIYEFDVELVERTVRNMKRGKAAGLDGLTVDHLINCHPAIYSILSMIFNMLVKYGVVPDDFCKSYTVPIPKCNVSTKSMSADDFRGISVSAVISKVFEGCILSRYNEFFYTSDSQFGFKKGVGCSHAIYTVKNVVNYYVNGGSTVSLCALDLKKAFDKVNHYGLYLKLMDRLIPNNLLCLFEYWYDYCITCVKWGDVFSSFYKLACGVRQGGVLSAYLFAIYVNDIIDVVQRSGYGCNIKFVPVCIVLFADDIILIAPSIESLQQMIYLCECELALLDMALNAKKTVCIRIGPRFDKPCVPLCTLDGHDLSWVKTCRYLGVYFLSSRNFKCSLENAKKSYYKSFNAIFGKLGRSASEEIILKLIQTKCIPAVLYGLEACSLNAADKHSLDFVFVRSLMKLFQTGSNVIITECRRVFDLKLLSELLKERRKTFLRKYANVCNIVCHVFAGTVVEELADVASRD